MKDGELVNDSIKMLKEKGRDVELVYFVLREKENDFYLFNKNKILDIHNYRDIAFDINEKIKELEGVTNE